MNKKKILAGVISTAMLLSLTGAVTAEDNDKYVMPVSAENSEDIMVISPIESTYDKMIMQGTVTEIVDGQVIFSDGETEFAINTDEKTIFVDEKGELSEIRDIKVNDSMMIVSSLAQTRSIPPQSYGYVIAKADGDIMPIYIEVEDINEDDKGNTFLTGRGGQYDVIFSSETEGDTKNIQEGTQLLAYSKIMTMSIPAKVPAEKIVVLEENTTPEKTVTVFDKIVVNGTVINASVKDGDTYLLPVRAISTALGLDVAWDDQLKAVTVGTVPMGINFNIGENSYNKARMMPFTLSSAPMLFEDTTFVPSDFFTEVLGAELTIEEGQININYSQN